MSIWGDESRTFLAIRGTMCSNSNSNNDNDDNDNDDDDNDDDNNNDDDDDTRQHPADIKIKRISDSF